MATAVRAIVTAAEGQFEAAIKGKTEAAREIADRLEGKAAQPISGDISSGMSVTVNIAVAREKLFGAQLETPTERELSSLVSHRRNCVSHAPTFKPDVTSERYLGNSGLQAPRNERSHKQQICSTLTSLGEPVDSAAWRLEELLSWNTILGGG